MRPALYFGLLLSVIFAGTASAGKLPADAQAKVDEYEADVKSRRSKLYGDLEALQASLTQKGDLDGALSVRNTIAEMKRADRLGALSIQADPGHLAAHKEAAIGKVLHFRVKGATSGGSVYGTDCYTTDSNLAVAAVHSGALADGQDGVVEVQLLKGSPAYKGTARHGVTSSSWSAYPVCYKLAAVK